MILVLLAAIIFMIIFIGFSHGWIKALIVFGACLGFILLAPLIMMLIGIDKVYYPTMGYFMPGALALGLILYILTGIFRKADQNKLKNERTINEIESVSREIADENKSESNDPAQVNEEIKQWRLAAGILFGLVMVFLLAFYRPRAMSGLYALASYAFWPLIFVTVIVFIILHQKEKNLKK